MDWDETRPKPARQIVVGEDLTAQSVDELTLRIASLEAEIERTRRELDVKAARKSAADALFRQAPKRDTA